MIKKLIGVCIASAMLLFSGVAMAQPNIPSLLEERKTILNQLSILENAWNINEAKRSKLEQRKDDLEWAATQVSNAVDKWTQDSALLDQKIEAHMAKINEHNSRCTGTFDDKSFVNQCNANAAQLNSYSQTLRNEENYLNERRAQIEWLIDTQIQQEDILKQEINAYNQERNELIAAGLKLEKRLNEIEAQLISCQNAIREYDDSNNKMTDGTMERMKAACGNMFDGG